MHDHINTISNRSSYECVSSGSIGDEWLGNADTEWGGEILETRIKSIGRRRARITISNSGITYKRISLPTEILQFISFK